MLPVFKSTTTEGSPSLLYCRHKIVTIPESMNEWVRCQKQEDV